MSRNKQSRERKNRARKKEKLVGNRHGDKPGMRKVSSEMKTEEAPARTPSNMPSEHRERGLFARWADFILGVVKAESALAGSLIQHPTRIGDAREALIQSVLSRIIPPAYEIGSGQIVDCHGRISRQIDIVIARKDFPSLRFGDGTAHYLIESVIATIEIKSELSSETFADALDNCKSVGELSPSFQPSTLIAFARKHGFEITRSGKLYSRDADGTTYAAPQVILDVMETWVRPACYIYGFSGYSTNLDAFKKQIQSWATMPGNGLRLCMLPALIAGSGCIAMRNTRGIFSDPARRIWPLFFVKKESNPLWCLIRELLTKIGSSVQIQPTSEGLRHTIETYWNADEMIEAETLLTTQERPRVAIEIPLSERIDPSDPGPI